MKAGPIKIAYAACCALAGLAIFLALATILSLNPVSASLRSIASDAQTLEITDRNGVPLTITYQNRWNSYDSVPLHGVPELLKNAFLLSEDRRFFDHGGVDWTARTGALLQDLRHGQVIRGASTISEQVVRMITPRPRTLWSKWLEGFEAMSLERSTSKADILEFYINQVPYAANRRGIFQAARYYFGRDLSTLSLREMLALVVLARAPSAYDLYRHPGRADKIIDRLAGQLEAQTLISGREYRAIREETLSPAMNHDNADALHFARYVRMSAQGRMDGNRRIQTTLDSALQRQVQTIVDQRVRALGKKNVHNAAALVADYRTGEILTWVVAGGGNDPDTPAAQIDTVLVPRQPGSSMKPFLYARALEKGWTAATILDDSPLAEAIGTGLHNFRNYSNVYYGPVPLREALGNSLNIPALRTIQFVGPGDYLGTLQALGFKSLDKSSEIYDEGLALGAGEVTLLELVQGYAALANRGVYRPLHALADDERVAESRRVFSPETTSIISSILSDPGARRLEFGAGSVLNLPVQTAAKTGTSTDYRDAWVAAYNDRYVVGLWMGNLDNRPMDGVTGSTGPALAMRSIFSVLNSERQTAPLYLSPKLVAMDICAQPAKDDPSCPRRTEWFAPDTVPQGDTAPSSSIHHPELVRPTDGLQMALDPRVPAAYQKFRFELTGLQPGEKADWIVDGEEAASTDGPRYLWPLERGQHILSVKVGSRVLPDVAFTVK